MKKNLIKKIIREESENSDIDKINKFYPENKLTEVDKELLYDYLTDSDGDYDEDYTRSFCKYLGFDPNTVSLGFFKELIDLNPGLINSISIEIPKFEKYEVLYDVYETQIVNSTWKVETFGWSDDNVMLRNGDDFDWWQDGNELSSEITHSETDEAKIISIKKIDNKD
jgi:hypothetical protein